ncbi:pyridoxal 5'-phosphate synthase glutaminase subunit PdxT [Thermococcus sp. 21S7]|uniref:pyridoxal 5'-phosphate synthase glutaminase subunit PdxT n=1 Tax=Thermococcus sp. 21S7 TaxID=1638221 RepID=UPI00143A20DD|nr:pyridoxal 5'-phosphate synthase glutaminase subunit PdxT [Thermococcus sp. 21S7]
MLKVGVIGLQGAVGEHIEAVKRAFEKLGVEGEVFWLKRPEQLNAIDAIILPGGESTTISRLMQKNGLFEPVMKLGEEGLPIMGTCAGLILLAKKVEGAVEGQRFLGLLDVRVNRNAYGRQVDSFEVPLKLSFSDEPFPGVFIRAPKIVGLLSDEVKPIAWHGEEVVGVEQGSIIGLAFHPELTESTALHEYLLKKAL